ncbi:hypothetical protein [Tepidibacillus marianensis]|uniref:hypothetical protein n=1 Tax=Tepidibacillus marianensis TaxID=3131995 RepID=UPI0030CB589B
MSFFGRPGGKGFIPLGDSIEISSGWNWFYFILEGVGYIIGGVFGASLLLLDDKKYCTKCNLYMKDKVLFTFYLKNYDKVIGELSSNLSSPENFKNYLVNKKNYSKHYDEPYGIVSTSYCPSCFDSFMDVKVMKKNSSDNFTEAKKYRQTSKIDSNLLLNNEKVS